MATLGNYYIDTSTFPTATAVWTDATFTTKAADGWYQECGVVRQQVGGFLLPPDSCPFPCNTDCGTPPLFNNTYFGEYQLPDIVVGTTVGAVKVELNFNDIPIGMYAQYGGDIYSAVSSQTFGYMAGPYIGSAAQFAAYGFPAGSPYVVPTFEWGGGAGNNWTPLATNTLNIAAGDTTSVAGSPSACILYIPKVDINPQKINVTVIAPVGASANVWSVTNNCVVALTSISVTDPAPSSVAACALPLVNTVYNGPVNGTSGVPGLYDWMFTDDQGASPMATAPGLGAGYYKYVEGGVNKWFQLDANSVITSLGLC